MKDDIHTCLNASPQEEEEESTQLSLSVAHLPQPRATKHQTRAQPRATKHQTRAHGRHGPDCRFVPTSATQLALPTYLTAISWSAR